MRRLRPAVPAPDFLAPVCVETDDSLLAFLHGHREGLAPGDSKRREPASAGDPPQPRWASRRPLAQEVLHGGDTVAINAAPLGPARGNGIVEKRDGGDFFEQFTIRREPSLVDDEPDHDCEDGEREQTDQSDEQDHAGRATVCCVHGGFLDFLLSTRYTARENNAK
jgi:hypothetical protein